VKGAEPGPELLPPLGKQSKKLKHKESKEAKKAKKAEEEAARRTTQRRSTSDLIGRREENGTTIGRDMRAQALAKQTATLRTINEKEREPPAPVVRRKSIEYNGRPSIMLGAEVSRAMKWADSFDSTKPERPERAEKPRVEKREEQKVREEENSLPERPQPAPQVQPKPKAPEPVVEKPQEIPREPLTVPKVEIPRSKTPEPPAPVKRPVLLEPEAAFNKPADKNKSPPRSGLKKFFGGKSKEEKAAKRGSRVMSPVPPSPVPTYETPELDSAPPPVVRPAARSVTPVPASVAEWESDFDGTHREEATTPTPAKQESYEPAPAPVVRSITPTPERPSTPPRARDTPPRERTSEDNDLDRWAQIRKQAGQRALNRAVAPPRDGDDIAEVNVPRVRQNTSSPKRGKPVKVGDEEDESVDARVARIRKRVQELTAGMGDN